MRFSVVREMAVERKSRKEGPACLIWSLKKGKRTRRAGSAAKFLSSDSL